MKKITISNYKAGLCCLLCLLQSCQKSDDASPDNACKLSRQLYSQTGSQGTYTTDYQYNYDASGRFVGQTSQSTNTPKTGTGYSTLVKNILVYDTDGYLTTQTSSYETKENGKTTVQSNTITYEYVSGRLVNQTTRSIGTKGEVEIYTIKNEYGSDGTISKITTTIRGSQYIQTFTKGLLTKYVNRDSNGNETQPATINSQGLITKLVRGSTSYDTYEYDSQLRQVREESWYLNKLNSYRLTEFDDKKPYYESTSPQFKGHPVVNTNGIYPNNYTKFTYYGLDNMSIMRKQSETIYAYIYNSKGYPSSYTFNDAVRGLTGQATFTFENCN